MAKTRQPTAKLELVGTFKKNPSRRRAREGEPEPTGGIGPAPGHLSALESAVWDELVAQACPGVLGNSDRAAFELLVVLYAAFRALGAAMPTTQVSQLRLMLAQFGMTPAARSTVKVPKGERKNPFEGFK